MAKARQKSKTKSSPPSNLGPKPNPWAMTTVRKGMATKKIVVPKGPRKPPMKGSPSFTVLFEITSKLKRPPKVSIITTVYDRVHLLRCCIGSVQKQQFQNFEHIIVSDCPPVEVTMDILNLVKDNDNGKMVYANLDRRYNNWGLAPALAGLSMARGNYVCFLSDDNAYLPEHLKNLVDELDRDDVIGFAYSNCMYRGRRILNPNTPRHGKFDLGQPLIRRHLLEDVNLMGNVVHSWDWHMISWLMRKGVRYKHVNKNTFVFRVGKYPKCLKQFSV